MQNITRLMDDLIYALLYLILNDTFVTVLVSNTFLIEIFIENSIKSYRETEFLY